jgi:hypothetical protein
MFPASRWKGWKFVERAADILAEITREQQDEVVRLVREF